MSKQIYEKEYLQRITMSKRGYEALKKYISYLDKKSKVMGRGKGSKTTEKDIKFLTEGIRKINELFYLGTEAGKLRKGFLTELTDKALQEIQKSKRDTFDKLRRAMYKLKWEKLKTLLEKAETLDKEKLLLNIPIRDIIAIYLERFRGLAGQDITQAKDKLDELLISFEYLLTIILELGKKKKVI